MKNRIPTPISLDWLIETLTGFKYIGEQIKFFEEQNTYSYQFGLEESYGCLIGTHARDKDAVAAVMALCQAAAYYRQKKSYFVGSDDSII